MAASIESRVPFLDDRSSSTSRRCRASSSCGCGRPKRSSVRRCATSSRRRSSTRKKMGFPVPVGRWLRDGFWPVVQEFVLSPRATSRGLFDRAALRAWPTSIASGRAGTAIGCGLLVNLEIWQRIFCEGEDPPHAVIARSICLYANPLGQDGWAVAVNDWRTGAKPADRVGAVPAS